MVRVFLILTLITALAKPSAKCQTSLPLNNLQEEAINVLNTLDTTKASSIWPNISSSAFYHNVKTNVLWPEKVYQGHNTNFCGYSAITVALCKEQPEIYVKMAMDLFTKGFAIINGQTLKPSASVRETAGILFGKGKLGMNPADQLWLMSLADHFKSYMNIDRKYKPGDENLIWAACTLGKFNRMAKSLGSYEVVSQGTDLIRPGIKNMAAFLQEELTKGTVVLYVNSKYLHPSKFRIFTLRAPTHFILLYDIREENGAIIFTYWDYGLKTLEVMWPRRIKKMTFGVIRLNKA